MLNHWRSVYDALESSTSRADVRATLADLASIADHEVEAAINAMDADTECEMIRGAYYWWKQHQQQPDLSDAATVRTLAHLALEHLRPNSGGRENFKATDIAFASALIFEYMRETGQHPTVITGGTTALMEYALIRYVFVKRYPYRKLPALFLDALRLVLKREKRQFVRGNKALRAAPARIGFWGL
jgi:hypothetical protein